MLETEDTKEMQDKQETTGSLLASRSSQSKTRMASPLLRRRTGSSSGLNSFGASLDMLNGMLNFFRSCICFCLLLLAVVVFLEWAFAVAHIGEDTVVKPDPLLGYSHLPNQNLCYRQEGYSRSRTNSFGFREREVSIAKTPGLTRICVLGDSMTVGMEVPPEANYTRLLENYLNNNGVLSPKGSQSKFEVLNCGMSGFGTGQEYLVYRQKVQQFQPDILLLSYNIGDAEDNVFQRIGMNPPRPIFRVDKGTLRADLQSVNDWFKTNDSRFYSSFEWLRRNSRVLAVLSKLNLDMGNSDQTYKLIVKTLGAPIGAVWNKMLSVLPSAPQAMVDPTISMVGFADPGTYESQRNELLAAAMPEPLRTPADAGTNELRQAFAVSRSAAEVSLGIIQALNNDCKRNNCKLFVVAGPALTNSMFYQRELQAIRTLAKRESFNLIEANKTFPPRAPMQESPYFFGLHFTKAGHQVMSKAIYFGLMDRLTALSGNKFPEFERDRRFESLNPIFQSLQDTGAVQRFRRRRTQVDRNSPEVSESEVFGSGTNQDSIGAAESIPAGERGENSGENLPTTGTALEIGRTAPSNSADTATIDLPALEDRVVPNDDENKKAKDDSTTESAADSTKEKVQKLDKLNNSRTGLTTEFGKPISTKKDVSELNEQIESQYQRLKYKKFAESGISSAIGDLLGPAKEQQDEDDSKKKSE